MIDCPLPMVLDTPLGLWPASFANWTPPPPDLPPATINIVETLTRFEADRLQAHERIALGLLHSDGPMSLATFHRRCKLTSKRKQDALFQLHRLGYIEIYRNATRDLLRAVRRCRRWTTNRGSFPAV